MNTRQIFTAAALTLAAAGAFAQEATVEPIVVMNGATTRAEVIAEARRALAAGELHESAQIEQDFAVDSTLSRQDVRTATLKSIQTGSVQRLNAQAYNFG